MGVLGLDGGDGTGEQRKEMEPAALRTPAKAATTTVFGYGSLMSESSCKRTCPSCENHRLAALHGWRRAFSLVSVSQIRNGNADMEHGKIAALAVSPDGGHGGRGGLVPRILGCVFEIKNDDLDELIRREHRYNMMKLPCYEISDPETCVIPVEQEPVWAIVFVASTDKEYIRKCEAEQQQQEQQSIPGTRYQEIVGQHYSGSLWHRTDILPVDKYLHFCIEAAEVLGGRVSRDNFLDNTFLADAKTSIREYLSLPSSFVRAPQSSKWCQLANHILMHMISYSTSDAIACMSSVCRSWLQATSDPRELFLLLESRFYGNLPVTHPIQIPRLTLQERRECTEIFDQLDILLHLIRSGLRALALCSDANSLSQSNKKCLDILRARLYDPNPGDGGDDVDSLEDKRDLEYALARRFIFYKWSILCKQSVSQLYVRNVRLKNSVDNIFMCGALRHSDYVDTVINVFWKWGLKQTFLLALGICWLHRRAWNCADDRERRAPKYYSVGIKLCPSLRLSKVSRRKTAGSGTRRHIPICLSDLNRPL